MIDLKDVKEFTCSSLLHLFPAVAAQCTIAVGRCIFPLTLGIFDFQKVKLSILWMFSFFIHRCISMHIDAYRHSPVEDLVTAMFSYLRLGDKLKMDQWEFLELHCLLAVLTSTNGGF